MSELFVGQELVEEKVFHKDEVIAFAKITGDNNPLHIDEKYAEESRFGRIIVHGIFVIGLFSKMIGTQMPGEGSIYLEQNSCFRKPVYVDEKVKVKIKIVDINQEKKVLTLETNVYKEDGEIAVEGVAKVLYEG